MEAKYLRIYSDLLAIILQEIMNNFSWKSQIVCEFKTIRTGSGRQRSHNGVGSVFAGSLTEAGIPHLGGGSQRTCKRLFKLFYKGAAINSAEVFCISVIFPFDSSTDKTLLANYMCSCRFKS